MSFKKKCAYIISEAEDEEGNYSGSDGDGSSGSYDGSFIDDTPYELPSMATPFDLPSMAVKMDKENVSIYKRKKK